MDRVVFLIYRAAGATLGRLPLGLVWRLGWMLGALAWLAARPYRQLALRNLRIAFPEKTEAERRAIARGHFRSLGANFLSGIKITRLPREQLRGLVEVEGIAHVEAAAGRGCVMVISHLGNWELFAQLYPLLFRGPFGALYQQLGNPHIDAEVRASRARMGVALFERKEGFSGALKTLRAGGIVGVLIDQHAGDAGVWCPFFGRLASTSPLAAMLALRTGAALVPGAMHTAGPGRWRLVIDAPVTPASREAGEVTAQLNEVLAAQIRRQPADWFWVHNRWKTPKPKFLLATYKRGLAGTPTQPFRIIIRSPNWLGDAVMAIPAVCAIKAGRPDAHVTLLTPAKLADLWRTVAEVDALLPIEPGKSVFAIARDVRAGNFDAAVLFPNSLRAALEIWLAGIPRRVGYPGHQRAWLLDQPLRGKKMKKKQTAPPRHHVHHYLALAEFIGADITVPSAPANRERTFSGGSPRIGLVPGAEYGPAKRWLPERFAEVIRAVPAQWTLFGVAGDRAIADTILAAAPGCRDLTGKTTLTELIAELRQCDLLLTNDTGTMHLAASLGVPVVAIFGSTEPALTGPLGAHHTVLRKHVECSPCFLRACPIDFRCMRSIAASEVIAALQRQLARR
jgi:lipopolysaccharide heptosyltransferase II